MEVRFSIFKKPSGQIAVKRYRHGITVMNKKTKELVQVRQDTDAKMGKFWKIIAHVKANTKRIGRLCAEMS